MVLDLQLTSQLLLHPAYYLLLKAHITESDVVCIFLTRSYITSANCMRELVAAFKQNKRIAVVLETDDAKGAPTEDDLNAELSQLRGYGTDEQVSDCRSCARLLIRWCLVDTFSRQQDTPLITLMTHLFETTEPFRDVVTPLITHPPVVSNISCWRR